MSLQYLRRLGWLNALTVVLVIAAAVLAALISLNVVEGGILLAVFAALTALAPQALKWFGQQRQQDREEASLLRIRRQLTKPALLLKEWAACEFKDTYSPKWKN